MRSIGIRASAAGGVRRPRLARTACLVASFVAGPLLVALAAATPVVAQEDAGVSRELLEYVLPDATRFTAREGDPPVMRGYAGDDAFVGFAFLTSDVPPEELGYNGPIEVLVGMDASGTLTGIVVVDYYESLRGSRGDFLARRGFQEQFTGKSISDAFRVRRDVDGISGATITVAAMSRGIRNAARRVWSTYVLADAVAGDDGPVPPVPGTEELERLSWLELASQGMLQKIMVQQEGVTRIELTLLRVKDDEAGHHLLGEEAFERALEEAGDKAEEGRHPWLIGVDGALTALFRSQALYVVQDDDTLRMSGNTVMIGEPRDGKADAQFRNAGLLLVDSVVDVKRPFTFLFDLDNGMGAFTARYPGEPGAVVATAGAPPPESAEEGEDDDAEGDGDAATLGSAGPPYDAEREATQRPAAAGDASAAGTDTAGGARTAADDGAPADAALAGGTDRPGDVVALSFQVDAGADETVLERTLQRTSWPTFGALAALLVLVSAAFFLKRPFLRGVALAATVVVLGLGGGFLSVSHLVAAIEVGPGVFMEDLPLLLLVSFTVVTTLLWGRVFCGYLCPFGALQDALAHVVPARFRRELPGRLHERGVLVKYGVLALVLLPAAAGSQATLFHWVEPFGTVFFLSSSALLWIIALGVLVASAIVPRFYCRYACPLGASLALASLLSPFRIRRVEQCTVCTVCERHCPTGAIQRERVDFKECVRCNVCETALEHRVGVCRHDMDDVRSRLVQIRVGARAGASGGR